MLSDEEKRLKWNAYMREYKARKRAEEKETKTETPKAEQSEPEQLSLVPQEQQDIAEQVVHKKTRGLKPASMEANFKGEPSDISRAIINATRYIKAEPCKSDEEVAERINEYFAECAAEGMIPKWETLSLALGVTRKITWQWANGHAGSPVRQRMLARAKEILAAVDAELVQTGKVNPVVYIFRAKNFYDMKDQQDVVVTPNQPLGEQQTTEQLEEKYTTLIELDDDE